MKAVRSFLMFMVVSALAACESSGAIDSNIDVMKQQRSSAALAAGAPIDPMAATSADCPWTIEEIKAHWRVGMRWSMHTCWGDRAHHYRTSWLCEVTCVDEAGVIVRYDRTDSEAIGPEQNIDMTQTCHTYLWEDIRNLAHYRVETQHRPLVSRDIESLLDVTKREEKSCCLSPGERLRGLRSVRIEYLVDYPGFARSVLAERIYTYSRADLGGFVGDSATQSEPS